MRQAAASTTSESINSRKYFLKPLLTMEISEAKYSLEPVEPMKVKATTALQEMAEEITEPLNEQ